MTIENISYKNIGELLFYVKKENFPTGWSILPNFFPSRVFYSFIIILVFSVYFIVVVVVVVV